MRKYLCKYIRPYQIGGRWNAMYINGKDIPFTLHVASCRTKKEAYELGKDQIDFLNGLRGV